MNRGKTIINAWVYFFNYTYRKSELREQILEWKEY